VESGPKIGPATGVIPTQEILGSDLLEMLVSSWVQETANHHGTESSTSAGPTTNLKRARLSDQRKPPYIELHPRPPQPEKSRACFFRGQSTIFFDPAIQQNHIHPGRDLTGLDSPRGV